nr:hypothetical protein HmN_000870200 [Hymenolepis microstoma]CUU99804.1 hypothetical transcript [Hymenolepis microstoma]
MSSLKYQRGRNCIGENVVLMELRKVDLLAGTQSKFCSRFESRPNLEVSHDSLFTFDIHEGGLTLLCEYLVKDMEILRNRIRVVVVTSDVTPIKESSESPSMMPSSSRALPQLLQSRQTVPLQCFNAKMKLSILHFCIADFVFSPFHRDAMTVRFSDKLTRQPVPSIGGRRIPGAKGVGGDVKSVSLIPALTPMDSSLIRNMDSHLVGGQRSKVSLFVFYVKDGQTSLTDVIVNMVSGGNYLILNFGLV